MTKTVTYLEMTDPGDLSPSPAVEGLDLRRVDRGDPLARSMQVRVGEPHGWRCVSRTDEEWPAHEAEHPLRQYWLVTLNGEPAGVGFLDPQAGGEVEITAFGLLPELVGKGLGGYALTLSLRQAWATEPIDAETVRRVWLHTCSNDHPHALENYQRRGLRVYRVDEDAS